VGKWRDNARQKGLCGSGQDRSFGSVGLDEGGSCWVKRLGFCYDLVLFV